MNPAITLLVGFYDEHEPSRSGELVDCLRRNCDNPRLATVHVFLEDGTRPRLSTTSCASSPTAAASQMVARDPTSELRKPKQVFGCLYAVKAPPMSDLSTPPTKRRTARYEMLMADEEVDRNHRIPLPHLGGLDSDKLEPPPIDVPLVRAIQIELQDEISRPVFDRQSVCPLLEHFGQEPTCRAFGEIERATMLARA
jgi:hypothetical protein